MPLHQACSVFGRSIFSLLFLATINTGIAQAQVIPDGTLPTSVQELENMRKITGGERVGNNLFHSFKDLSIPEGIEAVFENALDIENIFTRITGNETSFIDGLLQTQGGANFFLINPNGIVFGENARLDVGGSFVATTADTIKFADGTSFDARNPNVSLTISVPIGLGLYGNNGSITVEGSGNQITRPQLFAPYLRNRTSGLSVPSGKTLALIGKGINFNGGVIVSNGGKIELGSVNSGQVGLEENGDSGDWKLGYQEVQAFENINFNQKALIDPSGGDNSSIRVYGQDITFTDNSILIIQNNETKALGNINLNAFDLIKIIDESNIIAETVGEGNTSPISISAKNLLLQNSGAISSRTSGLGRGGDINIVVSEKLDVINSTTPTSPGSIFASSSGTGDSGHISVEAQEIRLSQGSSIATSTLGSGNGGDVSIDANLVELNGQIGENGRPTFIGSVTFGQQGADAGNVLINVANLKIINGAAISSDSNSDGSSGNIEVTATDSIEVLGKEPAQPFLSSITSSVTVEENETIRSLLRLPLSPKGNAGSVTINAPTINISQGGVVKVRNQSTGNAGTLTINADNLNLDQAGNITAAAESGIGGNIELNTQNLNITNDSQITASAGGDGSGGNISINTTNLTAKKNNQIPASAFEGDGGNVDINAADSVSLNDRDSISATSEAGEGGNITLNTDQLQIKNNSLISTAAGGLGNGGNIEINAGTILAINDSDITATAVRGDGGNITITADGILGLEERKATPGNGTSDIDASSEFGEDGTVKISDPQVLIQDPVIALREIPISDTTKELIEDICAEGKAIIKDSRHPDFSEDTDELSNNLEYSPPDDFVPQQEETPEPTSLESLVESLVWKPGAPLIPANHIVTLEDGRQFLVPKFQWEQLMRTRACSPKKNEEGQHPALKQRGFVP